MNFFIAFFPTTTNVLLAVLLLIVGLVLIIKGGDFFVDASIWVAEVLHMPKFLIGATIVSLATTLPELIVSVIAICSGNYEISVGNAVGSVTANTGLILAISAIFVSGNISDRKDFGIKSFLIILSIIILLSFGLTGTLGYLPSVLLALVLIFYMYETISSAKKSGGNQKKQEEIIVSKDKKTIVINLIKFITGTAGIVLGADLLVENAKVVALSIGISEGIIAITLVAIGTSLPELITTITSIVKKQGELGVGNIIGANIIDLVLILPVCSFISKGQLIVSEQSAYLDMPFCLALSIIAVVPPLITKKFQKWQGILMLAVYVVYIILAATIFK